MFTKRLPGIMSLSYDARLQLLGLERLELRRIHCDLIMCFKITHQLVMVALFNRATIIFSSCSFFLSMFFPRLISAVSDWMSTILPHMVWP